MPNYESQDIRVRLVVEVGAHVFTFEGRGKAQGAAYRGQEPELTSFRGAELERSIRGTVDTLTAKVGDLAAEFLADAYPLHDDPRGTA